MSFGFSVGDFIAVGTLAVRVGACLRETTGSSAQYQELALRFDSFELFFKTLQIQVTTSHLPPPTERAIKEHLSQCEKILQKFDEATQKFRSSLSKGGSGKKATDFRRQIQWGLGKGKDISELFNGLESHIAAINVYLSSYGIQLVAQMGETLKRIENAIPQDVEQWPDYKPVRFVDALDGKVLLPFECFRNYKVFEKMMRTHFDGRPGSQWVNKGLYEIEIMNENQRTPLTIKNWDDIVPGMELSMSILLKRQQKTSDRAGQSCPSCETPYNGYGKCRDLERVRCLNCRTWFQISSESRVVELSDDSNTQNQDLGVKPFSSTDDLVLAVDERKLIRRFHILLNQAEQNNLEPPLLRPVDPHPPLWPLRLAVSTFNVTSEVTLTRAPRSEL